MKVIDGLLVMTVASGSTFAVPMWILIVKSANLNEVSRLLLLIIVTDPMHFVISFYQNLTKIGG